MKKIIAAFLFISFCAHASDLIFCPSFIECDNNYCVFDQDNYWSAITQLTVPENINGQYRVSYVSAPYHIEDGGYAICVYTHTEQYQTLMLRARSDAKLVIFEDAYTRWRREESWGECRPNPLEACPLQLDTL
jgi:GH43 family beta-xylosidase